MTAKNLLVLCCHQPSLDPRIRWTAEFGQQNGYKTKVFGFNHKPQTPSPAAASSNVPERVFTPNESQSSNRYILGLMLKHGVIPKFPDLILLLVIGLILSPIILIGAGVKILKASGRLCVKALSTIFSIVKLLPKGNALYNVSAHAIRRTYHLTLRPILLFPIHVFRFIWRKLTHGRFTATIEALRGYRWYIFAHSARFATHLIKDCEDNENKPHVIHAHDPDALLAGVLLKKIYRARLIYDAHESGPDAYLIRPKPRYIFYAFERMLMKHVDAAVTVSPVLVAHFNARYKGRPQFHLLPNTSPRSDMDFAPPQKSDITKLSKGRTAVLFQGGLAPQRGVEWVLQEWADLNPQTAALFIRGPMNEYRKTLLSVAEGTGLLNQSIFFLESIPEDDLIKQASAADIGVIPYHSHVENHRGACPNKLSQYMMAGLAVVSTPIPFIQETLERAGAGLTYNDALRGDFKNIIGDLLSDPAKVKAFGVSAQKASRTWFNFESYAAVLLTLYSHEA